VQKQLSTATSAPWAWAISARRRMSATSVSGLDGVSRKNSLVFGRTACSQAATSVWPTKVVSSPKRERMPEKSCTVAPKRPVEATMWSPALRWAMTSERIADMPEAVATQASAPSSPASRSWKAATVGLVKRE